MDGPSTSLMISTIGYASCMEENTEVTRWKVLDHGGVNNDMQALDNRAS